MKPLIQNFFKLLLSYFPRYLGIYFAVTLLLGFITIRFDMFDAALSLTTPLFGIGFVIWYMKKRGINTNALKLPESISKEMIQDISAVFGLDIAFTWLASLILGLFMQVEGNIDVVEVQNHLILQLITAGILVPIDEEFFFRGFLSTRLDHHSRIKAAFLISIFFGLAHLNVLVSISAFLTSFCLLALRYKYHSVWPGIVVHMAVNFLNILSVYINPDDWNAIDLIFIVFIGYALIHIWTHKHTIKDEFLDCFKDSEKLYKKSEIIPENEMCS